MCIGRVDTGDPGWAFVSILNVLVPCKMDFVTSGTITKFTVSETNGEATVQIYMCFIGP